MAPHSQQADINVAVLFSRSTRYSSTFAALWLGRKKTILLFIALVATVYIITGIEILTGVISLWGFLILLSFPVILKLILRFQREKTIPSDADPQVARAGMIYGVLLIASFLIPVIF
jgi:1,4-dihydroxy-2-naphthoate octaprenyltransferase